MTQRKSLQVTVCFYTSNFFFFLVENIPAKETHTIFERKISHLVLLLEVVHLEFQMNPVHSKLKMKVFQPSEFLFFLPPGGKGHRIKASQIEQVAQGH